jgi:hypothetical protein
LTVLTHFPQLLSTTELRGTQGEEWEPAPATNQPMEAASTKTVAMKLIEAAIGWDALTANGKTEIEVGPYPDRTGWTSRYDGLLGGCMPIVQELHPAEWAAMLFVDFNTLVVGHGLDPMTVHREFLKIDEYRRMIPPDHR